MMNRKELEQQIQAIRTLLRDTFTKITSVNNPMLPTPDISVKTAGTIIQQEQYDVVVCGEVKKGKSSFINALMGDEVLPTNTQVATSQVFRIINSDTEEYSLVFTDGQRQRISRSDLSRYGSQVDADMYGEPIFQGRQLDYIEVKHPIPSLPKSVALIDTPGIGALYAAHEQITRNYLSKAAAVIFVTDPKNPIVVKEREFIESALKVTKQLMVVMTKMDNYDEHVIATMISRNEEILAPLAKQTASGEISILPISSTILFDANKERDEILMEMSCFEEVKEYLLKMIYNTVGFGISAAVYSALNQYNTRVMHAIKEMQDATTAAPEKAKELVIQKQQKLQEFIQNWGTNGAKMNEVSAAIGKQIKAMENNARALFSQSHPIIRSMQQEIDNLNSPSDAEVLSQNITSRLADAYGKAWKDIIEECENNIESILIQYNAHLCNTEEINSGVGIDSFHRKNQSFIDKLTTSRNSYFTGTFVGTLSLIPLSILAAPIAVGIAVLLGIGAGWLTQRDNKLKQWKQDLNSHLIKCHSQIYDNFMVQTEDGQTKLQMAGDAIMSQSMKAIKTIYEQHKTTLDEQIKEIEGQIQANTEEKKKKLEELVSLQQIWKPISDNLQKARTLLTQMSEQQTL